MFTYLILGVLYEINPNKFFFFLLAINSFALLVNRYLQIFVDRLFPAYVCIVLRCLKSIWAAKTKYYRLGVLLTTETYFSQFQRLKFQDQRAGRFHIWWEPALLFTDYCLLTESLRGRRNKGVLWYVFHKGTNPIHEGPILMTESPPKAFTFQSHWGLGFKKIYKFGRDINFQSIALGIILFFV